MKRIYFLLILSFLSMSLQAQEKKARLMRESETERLFPQEARTILGIDSSIYRAYTYTDKLGTFYILLSEKTVWSKEGRANKDSIEAVCLKKKRKGYEKHWAFNVTLPDSLHNPNEEYTLFFMTKYLQLRDIDSNGTVDPMLVYATRAMNDFDDGRIVIYLFNKGERIAIKHQNGVLDNERFTKIDRSFYRLPYSMQEECKKYMRWMTDARQAIFPYGWEKKMKKKKSYFDEK